MIHCVCGGVICQLDWRQENAWFLATQDQLLSGKSTQWISYLLLSTDLHWAARSKNWDIACVSVACVCAAVSNIKMQFRTVLDVKVVDVEKRRNPSKHYVSIPPHYIYLGRSNATTVMTICYFQKTDIYGLFLTALNEIQSYWLWKDFPRHMFIVMLLIDSHSLHCQCQVCDTCRKTTVIHTTSMTPCTM